MPSPEELQRMVVHAALPCRRCQQLLIGLPVAGDCPECGLAIESSLRSTIDLESLEDNELRRPRRVAVAMLALAVAATGTVLGSLIVALFSTSLLRGSFFPLPILLAVVIATSLLMIGGLCLLLSATRDEPTGAPRTVRWILASATTIAAGSCLGFALWAPDASFGRLNPRAVLLGDLLLLLAAMLALIELSHLLRSIGARSEAYRQAGIGLQPAGPMVVGLGFQLLLLLVLIGIASRPAWVETAGSVLTLLRLVVGLMLGVGALYFTANTIWAIRPLLREHHRWSDLVGPTEPASMADRPKDQDTS